MDELFGDLFEPILKIYDQSYDYCETNTSSSIKQAFNINHVPNEAICTGLVIIILTAFFISFCTCCYCCCFRSKSSLDMYDSTESMNELHVLAMEREYEERILKLENEVNILKDKINNKPSFSMALTGCKSDDLSLLISNTANKQINSRKQTEKNIVISGLAPSDNDDSKIDEILETPNVVEPNARAGVR